MSDQESTIEREITQTKQIPETGTKTCANCGITVNEYEWFPIRGRTDEDDEFRIYSFCSEECVESWEDS